jgi:predicted CopG family antitoxin
MTRVKDHPLTIPPQCAHIACMSRNVNLDDEAVAALEAHRRGRESFSKVVKRLAPRPIRTFGDLEKFLAETEGPIFSDLEVLKKIRERKLKASRAH